MPFADLSLWAFVAATFVAALSGAIFKPGPWYDALSKPSWTPPGFLFPIAWTLLYAMIAVAGWIAYGAAGGVFAAPLAFLLYFGQLALNAGWSAVFFGMRRPDLALVEVAALWLSIVGAIIAFAALDWRAAALMVPYLFWVSFAAVLNHAIWRLNPDEKGQAA